MKNKYTEHFFAKFPEMKGRQNCDCFVRDDVTCWLSLKDQEEYKSAISKSPKDKKEWKKPGRLH